MKRTLLLSLFVAVTACGEERATEAPPPSAEPAAAASGGPGIQRGLRWETKVGGSGVALTLHGPQEDPLLRLACTRDPAELVVTAETFRAIASEERLTLGLGGEAYTLVADPTDGRPSGVEARGPVPPDLLDRLVGANEVSAVYGTQRIGPHIPPDPESARAFAGACRQAIAPATRPETTPAVVPTGYRGEWNINLADCGTGRNDSRLRIGADRIRFYESSGPVTAVERRGANEIGVTVALSGEGEGPTEEEYEFRLSADRNTLTDANGGVVRRRCPGG